MQNDVYKENGYANRNDYLMSLAEEWGIDLHVVHMVAALLGPNEDFDGLVTSLEDYVDFGI